MTRRTVLLVWMAVAGVLGCRSETPMPTTAHEGISLARGTEDNSRYVGDVMSGDFVLTQGDAPALASTCPGSAGNGSGNVDFGHSLCLMVWPLWNTASGFEPYELTDDVILVATKEKGKNGRITHVRLLAQDVIGDAGIQHRSDLVPVAQPIIPSTAGYTIHVHAANVPVTRLSGHTSGDPVAVIGWISVGDIVIRPR